MPSWAWIPASSDNGGGKTIALSADSSVDVVEDAGPEEDKARPVQVLVTKGPQLGRTVTVARSYLFRIHLANPEPEPFRIRPPDAKNWLGTAPQIGDEPKNALCDSLELIAPKLLLNVWPVFRSK